MQPEDVSVSGDSYSGSDAEAARPLNQYVVRPGEPFPPTPGNQDIYLCSFAEDDPDRPMNWPAWQRWGIKLLASVNITFVSWGSSAISPGLPFIMKEFHIGEVTAVLLITLYVLGFACGPSIFGPSSELYGRRWPLIIGMFGFTLFGFAAATAKDLQTLMLCRFFMGTFGCATLVVGPAISADLFNSFERGKAVSMVILCLVAGPMVSPVVCGYIAYSYLGWRWTMYITAIMGSLGLVLEILFLKESYPQVALRDRAAMIRKETGNWAVSAPIEGMEIDFNNILHRTLLKPIRMLTVEPVLLLLSLYQGFVYSLIYMCLVALPYTFQTVYHWKGGNAYLPYLGMFIGSVIVVIINLIIFEPLGAKMLIRSGKDVYPESRIPLMVMGGFVLPMGLFLLFWAGAYKVHWIAPTIGAALVGYGLIALFQSILIFIIDTYLVVAASAIAGNTFVRSSMAAGFPLFTHAMFHNLGIQWAGTLLGCLAAILVPIPIAFYYFGDYLRSKSKYAQNNEEDMEDLKLQLSGDPLTRGSFGSVSQL